MLLGPLWMSAMLSLPLGYAEVCGSLGEGYGKGEGEAAVVLGSRSALWRWSSRVGLWGNTVLAHSMHSFR